MEDVCAICLESTTSSDCIDTLQCSHSFHKICITKWERNNRRTCPMCREEFVVNIENSSFENSENNQEEIHNDIINISKPLWGILAIIVFIIIVVLVGSLINAIIRHVKN